MPELRSQALQLLSLCDPAEKGAAVIALREQYLQGGITINANDQENSRIKTPEK